MHDKYARTDGVDCRSDHYMNLADTKPNQVENWFRITVDVQKAVRTRVCSRKSPSWSTTQHLRSTIYSGKS